MLTASQVSGFFLPVPADPHLNVAGTWVGTVVLGVLAIVSSAWLVTLSVKRRDPIPAMLVIAGVLAFCGEWLGDIAYNIYYHSDGPVVIYSLFQRHVPLWILFLWVFYVPTSAFIASRLITKRAQISTLVAFAVGAGVAEVSAEVVMNQFGSITYYGNYAKVLGIPVTSIVQNGFMYLALGVLIVRLAPRLKGWRCLLLPPAVVLGGGAFFLVAIPNYLVIGNGDFPGVIVWSVAIALSGAEIALAIWAVARHYRNNPLPSDDSEPVRPLEVASSLPAERI